MLVGRIGTISSNGETVIYDGRTQQLHSIPVPRVEVGVELLQDKEGNWHASLDGLDPITARRLSQADEFYYKTRDFLSYDKYLNVLKNYPTNCADLYNANPFFLCSVKKDGGESSIATFPEVDSHIVLSTFEERLREMREAMLYVLKKNEEQENTWLTYEEFDKRVRRQLAIDGHPLLTGSVRPYANYFESDFALDILDGEEIIGLSSTYYRERAVYRSVRYAREHHTPFPMFKVTNAEGASESQVRAVEGLVCKGGRIVILTGGPGTGKTTTLKVLVHNLCAQYDSPSIFLLSPTGKAARRISEVFGGEPVAVSTVHKFVGFGHPILPRDIARVKSTDVIIVDEASMLNLDIFERLLTMVDFSKTKLILVGDVDQLPAIGIGNILHDLILLGVHTERLTENFRSVGTIVKNANKINRMELDLEEAEDFVITDCPKDISSYLSGINRGADIVITPYKQESKLGNAGYINSVVQNRVFEGAGYCPNKFRVGDIILMVRTNYKVGYFNGEVGRVVSYLPSGDYVVSFEDRTLTISNPSDMELGYAITAHKSQGSEYDHLEICIPEYSDFITKRMFYTAVTRAKRSVTIRASRETIRKVILNCKEDKRRTFLSIFDRLELA